MPKTFKGPACPFCGSCKISLGKIYQQKYWEVHCSNCRAAAAGSPYRKVAIRNWKRRSKTNKSVDIKIIVWEELLQEIQEKGYAKLR